MIKGLVFICIIVSNIQKHQCFSLPTPPSLRQRRSSINSKLSSHQQLFLDTASVEQWERQIPLGIFHGITTNPVLLERAKVPCELESLKNLAHVALHEFKMEVFMIQSWGGTTDTLVRNALYLQDISDKIVVKIPLTREGVEAAAILKRHQVRLCMTACFTPHQVFTSACLGAEYVAPYLGRITDSGISALNLNTNVLTY
jgi:transaldolase